VIGPRGRCATRGGPAGCPARSAVRAAWSAAEYLSEGALFAGFAYQSASGDGREASVLGPAGRGTASRRPRLLAECPGAGGCGVEARGSPGDLPDRDGWVLETPFAGRACVAVPGSGISVPPVVGPCPTRARLAGRSSCSRPASSSASGAPPPSAAMARGRRRIIRQVAHSAAREELREPRSRLPAAWASGAGFPGRRPERAGRGFGAGRGVVSVRDIVSMPKTGRRASHRGPSTPP
jgi:hypothetical protein